MSSVSTHVLDITKGQPAAGIVVRLEQQSLDRTGWSEQAQAITGHDGRCRDIPAWSQLPPAYYRLIFATAAYFFAQQIVSLYPEITISFEIRDANTHYHLPLLLSPHGYTTYRGT